MYHRQGHTNYHHQCLAMMQKSTQKQTWNHDGTVLVCSNKWLANFSGTTTCPRKLKEQMYGTTYKNQEKDAADGTSFEPSDPGRDTRQFPSSETSQCTMNAGTKVHQHNQKRKTLPQDYHHHLCVSSLSNRRRSLATRRCCWLQHQQDEAYSSRWSGWPFSERVEGTSNHASQYLLDGWWWFRSLRAQPNYRTH